MEDLQKITGQRIRQLVSGAGLSCQDLADRLGVTKGTISRFVNETRTPELSTAVKISKYFNVSLDWLCGLTDERYTDDMSKELCSVYPLMNDEEKAVISIFMAKYQKGANNEKSD